MPTPVAAFEKPADTAPLGQLRVRVTARTMLLSSGPHALLLDARRPARTSLPCRPARTQLFPSFECQAHSSSAGHVKEEDMDWCGSPLSSVAYISVCGFERRMDWMSVSVVLCSLSVRDACFDFSVIVLFCRAQFNCMPVPRKFLIYTFSAWSVRMAWPRRALNPKLAFHTNEGFYRRAMFSFYPLQLDREQIICCFIVTKMVYTQYRDSTLRQNG